MGPKSILAIIVVVITAVILIIFFLIRGVTSNKNGEKPTPSAVAKTVAAADINADPLVYEGLNVTVEAPISDWVTKRSFTLSAGSSGGILGSGSRGQLLVITKKPFSLPKTTTDEKVGLGDSSNTRVKGRVVILNREQLASELGVDLDSDEFGLDDNNVNQWKLGSVLLADSVEKIK